MSWFRPVEAVDAAERRRQELHQEAEESRLAKMSNNLPDHRVKSRSWRSRVVSLVLTVARISLLR
jgi:hypothetical protein